MSRMVKDELKFIIPCVAIADIVVYLISFIFKGFNYDVILGLLLGSVTLILNLIVLGEDVELTFRRFALDKNEKRAKRKMASSYAIRSIIVAVAIFISLVSDLFDTIGVLIPFLYVKPIYFIKSIYSDKKEGK
jgi:hypothetical protein